MRCSTDTATGHIATTLNSPISVGGKFNMEIINVGHTNCLVKVEIIWASDPMSSLSLPGNLEPTS